MSLSMADVLRFQSLELRVAELEKRQCNCRPVLNEAAEEMYAQEPKRRGRPPKNLEERMKAQEHDPIDAE